MTALLKLQKWGNTHHPAWIDLFRIGLGIVLIWKGIQFATNLDAFSEWMAKCKLMASFGISFVAHLVILIHIIGGFMILIGTNTRAACLMQLPILITAIFYVNLPANVMQPYADFWLAIIVLFGLVFFIVEGDGPFSVEHNTLHHA